MKSQHQAGFSIAGCRQQGFTIVEIMIATTVLSVLLLLASAVIMGIGNIYSKGVSQTTVQTAARNTIDQISQDLQLNKNYSSDVPLPSSPNTPHVVCVGSTRYTYIVGVKIGSTSGSNTYRHVLWRDNDGANCVASGSNAANLTADDPDAGLSGITGSEMMAPRSRLAYLNIAPNSGVYAVDLVIAYGDDDLLTEMSGIDIQCKPGTGDQYCATVKLSTTVVQRVT